MDNTSDLAFSIIIILNMTCICVASDRQEHIIPLIVSNEGGVLVSEGIKLYVQLLLYIMSITNEPIY